MSSLKLFQVKTLFILGWRCYGLCKPRKTNWARAFVPPGAKTFEDYKERRSSYSEDFEPLLSSNGIVWNNLWFFCLFLPYLLHTHLHSVSHPSHFWAVRFLKYSYIYYHHFLLFTSCWFVINMEVFSEW